MNLDPIQKAKFLKTVKKVYENYLALDFFKNYEFSYTHKGNQRDVKLIDECRALLKSSKKSKKLIIKGIPYRLSLSGEGSQYQISINREMMGKGNEQSFKPIADYSPTDVLDLFARQKFVIEEGKEGEIHLSNLAQKKAKTGGVGRIDLYRSHLITLYNIIKKLESKDDLSNLLVALATGSGKTFVQALWMLVNLSNNHAVFAVPDKLISQFQKDLRLLLPEEMLSNAAIIRQGDKKEEDEALLAELAKEDSEPKLIIASSEQLLDKHYSWLLKANPKRTFLSFDEPHLLAKQESRGVRFTQLSRRILSLFFTATPNEEIYNLAGKKPVAMMSNGQKQKNGQGQFPVIKTVEAKNVADKNPWKTYKFWTKAFWEQVYRGFVLRFSDAIQEDCSSIGVSIVEEMPFLVHHKPDESDPRWSMQVPMAHHMLFIVDDNETLITFANALSNPADLTVYKNGNFINRSTIAEVFLLKDVEKEIKVEYRARKKAEYIEDLPRSAETKQKGKELVEQSLQTQVEHNIFHAMVEYVLIDLTGLDKVTHNRMRREDPKAFQKLIKRKLGESPVGGVARDRSYYEKKLSTLIDAEGAGEIAPILFSLHDALSQYSQDRYVPQGFNAFVDNWSLNYTMKDKILARSAVLSQSFHTYAANHRIMGIMSGMANAETPIEESRPFFGFVKQSYPMYENGVLAHEAKKRGHTPMETLNEQSQEARLIPRYADITEGQCDNYSRLGFVGVYLSNRKTEGFNNKDLHTVINLAQRKLSSTNSPDSLIQGLGRNRGLDDTVIPTYIHARGRGEGAIHFDLNHLLQEDDYYPALFEAQRNYNKEFLVVLGERVGHEVLEWFNANVAADESIDQEQLKRQALRIITKALREINNKNDHNIELSRDQLTTVVDIAMDTLDAEIKRIKESYKLPLFVRAVGSLLNFIADVYYTFKQIPAAFGRFKFRFSNKPKPSVAEQSNPDEVYNKILDNNSYKDLVEKNNIFREFRGWLIRSRKGVKYRIKRDPDSYLRQEIANEIILHKDQFLWPVLAKFVVPKKRDLVLKALENFSSPLTFCYEYGETIERITKPGYPTFREEALPLMRLIPGLEELSLADMADFPTQLETAMKQLQHSDPLQIIKEDAELRAHVIADLSQYLKGSFLESAKAFFAPSDHQLLKAILSTEGNVKGFLNYLLSQDHDHNLKDMNSLVQAFRSFFNLEPEDFADLDQRAKGHIKELKAVTDDLTKDPMSQIKEEEIEEIATILSNSILPSLVNLYPLQDRQALWALVNVKSLKEVIKSGGNELFSVAGHEDFARILFSKLNKDETRKLPEQLDLKEEVEASKTLLVKKFTEIANTKPEEVVTSSMKVLFSFNISKMKETLKNPQYLLEGKVSDFIRSDDFLNAISLLMPYPSWLDFKKSVRTDTEATTNFSRALLDITKSDRGSSLDQNTLLECINTRYSKNYRLAPTAAEEGVEQLAELKKSLENNPVESLSKEALTRVSNVAHGHLLPLLASFIKDQDKQLTLIKVKLDDLEMAHYVYQNKLVLEDLAELDAGQAIPAVEKLINPLLPDDQKLTTADLVYPKDYAESMAKKTSEELNQQGLSSYLTSAYFAQLISPFFNQEDCKAIDTVLANQNKRETIVEQLIPEGLGSKSIDKDKALAIFKKDQSLEKLETLDKRLKAFEEVVEFIKKDKLGRLDQDKLADLLAGLLSKILFHKRFYSTLNGLIGYLNTPDLTTLIAKLGKDNPGEKAKQISQFLVILKNKDEQALKTGFLTLADNNTTKLKDLELVKIFELIAELVTEIRDCHCYYNQHSFRGDRSQQSIPEPKLLDHLSEDLKAIQVDSNDSPLSRYSPRLFFMQAIKEGLPTMSEISGDSHGPQVEYLGCVKDHLLKPLSTMPDSFVQGGQEAAFPVWSEEYNKSARALSKQMHELVPLNAETVADEDCPPDVVSFLEDKIPSTPIPRFFPRTTASKAQIPPTEIVSMSQ